MAKIVVVGQTPPPFGGQAVMIRELLNHEYDNIDLFHVRMAFSKEMDEIGKVRLNKLLELVTVILRIIWIRIRSSAQILYYPPAGPNMVPVLRDIVILCAVRWLFDVTIFHFEANGLSEIYPRLSAPMKFLFRRAYFYPDIVVRLSEYSPEDGKMLFAKREFIVANCAPDMPEQNEHPQGTSAESTTDLVTILFVGVVCEEKGVGILLQALAMLKERGYRFRAQFVGKFESLEYEKRIYSFISSSHLEKDVSFLGVLTGNTKYSAYRNADIFCFPTFFNSEGFSIVLLEAMSFSLPVVTTDWRGLKSIVDEGESGFLVPIHDADAVANRLSYLIDTPRLREEMGRVGRRRYEERFTAEVYHRSFQQVFSVAAEMLLAGRRN